MAVKYLPDAYFIFKKIDKMSLTIKQYKEKWRIAIEKEEWEFKDEDEFKKLLSELIRHKKSYGRLNNE